MLPCFVDNHNVDRGTDVKWYVVNFDLNHSARIGGVVSCPKKERTVDYIQSSRRLPQNPEMFFVRSIAKSPWTDSCEYRNVYGTTCGVVYRFQFNKPHGRNAGFHAYEGNNQVLARITGEPYVGIRQGTVKALRCIQKGLPDVFGEKVHLVRDRALLSTDCGGYFVCTEFWIFRNSSGSGDHPARPKNLTDSAAARPLFGNSTAQRVRGDNDACIGADNDDCCRFPTRRQREQCENYRKTLRIDFDRSIVDGEIKSHGVSR